MDISIFLAKFWGWYFITFFVLLIIYPKRIKQLFEYTKDEKVTLRRLLTHTAGMTVSGFPGYQQSDTFPSIVKICISTSPVKFLREILILSFAGFG